MDPRALHYSPKKGFHLGQLCTPFHVPLFLLKTSFLAIIWSERTIKTSKTKRAKNSWAVPSLPQSSLLPKTRSGIRQEDCLLCGGPWGAVFLLKTFSFQSCQTGTFHQHNRFYYHRATLLLRWWCRQLNTTSLCPNQLVLVNRIQKSH